MKPDDNDNPVKRVFEAHGVGDIYRQQQLELVKGKTLMYMTPEEKRYLLSLLKREINHNNLHLNSTRGKYRQDHIAYNNELAVSLRRSLLLSPDPASAYRRRKAL